MGSGVEEKVGELLLRPGHLDSFVARLLLEEEKDLMVFVFYLSGLKFKCLLTNF